MSTAEHVDVSHVIEDGMKTDPGLPVPHIADHLTHEAAETVYRPGTTFQIGLVTMCTNTGTYLDVPFHRFADGHDLTGAGPVPRRRRAGRLPPAHGHPGHRPRRLRPCRLCRADGARPHRSLPSPAHGRVLHRSPAPDGGRAAALVRAGVACVGVDSLNNDGTSTGDQPVHTELLRAGVPIIEHLTALDRLPARGFRFTAVPPKIRGAGTFTVQAFATLEA